MEWIWSNLTGIAAIVAIFTGLAGLVVSVWTRVDQRREARERRRESTPYFKAKIGKALAGEDWRILTLTFYSPNMLAFTMHRVEIVKPRGALLSPRVKSRRDLARDTSISSRKITVTWRSDPPPKPTEAASQTFIFCKLPSSANLAATLRINARAISATQRYFKMHADASVDV